MDSLFGGGEAIGWTVVTVTDDQMVPYEISWTTETSVSSAALFTDQVLTARMTLEQEQGMADERNALLIAVAQEVGADLLVTERAPLLDTRLLERGNCQVVGPADALALVALYLRAAGEFITAKLDGWSFTATRTRFYQQMAEAHLPSLADFVRRAGGSVSAARLLTVLSRARTLFAVRDRIALLTSEPATEDNAEEISLTFTHALVDMVAFHDVLARIVNEFLELPETDRQWIKWQNQRWRERATREFAELAALWSADGYASNVNQALRDMRNEIHDVAPSIVPFKDVDGAARVGLAFHVDVGTKVTMSLDRISQGRNYGVRQAFADGHLVDPHLFYEFVLPWMLHSVEDILGALVRRLPERASSEQTSLLPDDVRDEALRALARIAPRQ